MSKILLLDREKGGDMRIWRVIWTLLLFLSSISFTIGAYDLENIQFKRLSVTDGLNNSIVYKVIQDGDGVLWFGLNHGLDKFNGYDFKHYDLIRSQSESIEVHQAVLAIYQVSKFDFIVGSGSNIYRYNIEKDQFETLLQDLRNVQPVNQISSIYLSSDSICYIGTNLGLFSFDIKSGETKFYNEYPVSTLSLHYFENLLWVGTGNGTKFFDTRKQEYTTLFNDVEVEGILNSIDALCFYSDFERKFTLIGARNSGLYYFDHNTIQIKELKNRDNSFPHTRVIKKYREYYVLGTDGYGLIILNQDFEIIAQYQHDEDNPNSLSNDGIYDIHIDPEERIWITTYGGGINIFDPNTKPFHIYRHEYNNRNSLRNNVSRSFLEVGENMIFGTARGLSVLGPDSSWAHIPGYKKSDKSKVVLSMCEDHNGMIWIGTFSGGVEIRNKDGKLVRKLRSNNSDGPELSTDYVYKVFKDSDNNIWMGGIRGGLMCYNPKTDKISEFPSIQNVHDIIETSDNRIMVGTLNGVRLLQKYQNVFNIIETDDTLLINRNLRVFSILERKDGEFWIGTEGNGLVNYIRSTNVLRQYTSKDGLPSNIIYGILQDKTSRLWLSTTSGITRYDPIDEKFKNYTVTDGVSGKDFNYGAYYKASDGTLFFGGSAGVTAFRPEEIRENTRVPKIVFTDISVYGKDANDPENPLFSKNINLLDDIQLNYNQSSFAISFAAINYTAAAKNLYQWKISGGGMGEGEWTRPSTERRAVFSYLPPGDYSLSVRASNNDGLWNEAGKNINISIAPPFWKTKLANVVYIILAILLFVGLQRYIITFIKERQAKEKISFFINVAHDIRTPLTLISAPINKLMKSEKLTVKEKEEIELAARNSDRLNRLVNQLLDFQKATLNKHVLQVSEQNLIELINEILNNFQPLMDQRMINYQLIAPSEGIMIWFDRQKIEKVLYNLISNAIKYSNKGGEITVEVERISSRIKILVKDKGKGIPAKQQKEIFKRYFRAKNVINSREPGSGVGLMLSKKLMQLHRGNLNFKSLENKGSVFSIEFPVYKDSYKNTELASNEEPVGGQLNEAIPEEIDFSQNYTLLIVEDNPDLRRYLRTELSKKYNILSAKNGKQAFDIILKMDIDLIISDIMMPEMDGRALCYKVRSNIASSHIPIILLTALNSLQYKIEGLEYGADDYIEKPFDINYLKVKITNLLKSREYLRKRFLEQPDRQTTDEIVNKPDQDLMKNLNDIVKSRISKEDFSVKEMCQLMGMSRPVLYRKLKAYTGHSPQEYLIILRLNHASKLFREGRESIKEVAYESGFSDPKYFSKCFKKHYGVNPTSYIRGELHI